MAKKRHKGGKRTTFEAMVVVGANGKASMAFQKRDFDKDLLAGIEEMVKRDDWDTAINMGRDADFRNFLESFADSSEDVDISSQDNIRAIRKVLSIANKAYEISGGKEFIPENLYDRLSERFQSLGYTMPSFIGDIDEDVIPASEVNNNSTSEIIDVPYTEVDTKSSGDNPEVLVVEEIPENSEPTTDNRHLPALPSPPTMQYGTVKWDLLQNQMMKTYKVKRSDPEPIGPTAKNRITAEDWLEDCYHALGLTCNTAIAMYYEPKIDGISVNADMEDFIMSNALTRGNGTKSVKILGLEGYENTNVVPFRHPKVGVQFELFITREQDEALTSLLGNTAASLRNRAAGVAKRLYSGPNKAILNNVSLYPIETQGTYMSYLDRKKFIWGFAKVPADMVKPGLFTGTFSEHLDHMQLCVQQLSNMRDKLSFDVDGVVVSIVNDDFQKSLGRNGFINKWQVAIKFDPETARVSISHVNLTAGTRGTRNIAVYFNRPGIIQGQVYDHVDVPTIDQFDAMDLHIGQAVTLARVNDVKPVIIPGEYHGNNPKLILPSNCPICGWKLETDGHGKRLFCSNPNCNGNIAGKLTRFFRDVGLVGYDEGFANRLVAMGVTNIADLFKFTAREFSSRGNCTAGDAAFLGKLQLAIGNTPDATILGAIGIPGIAAKTADTMLEAYGKECQSNELPFDHMIRVIESGDEFSDYAPLSIGKKGQEFRLRVYEDPVFRETFLTEIKAIRPWMTRFRLAGKDVIYIGHTGFSRGANILNYLTPEAKDSFYEKGYRFTDGNNYSILVKHSKNVATAKSAAAEKNDKIVVFDSIGEFENWLTNN